MAKYNVFAAVDPGISGGISIINSKNSPLVYKMPIHSIVINKKNKKEYDLDEILDILKKYRSKKVLFIQEKVRSRPGEGSVSSFGFGRSSGFTIGMAKALEFDVVEISSQKWKKYFPKLITDGIISRKEEIKKIRTLTKVEIDKLQILSKTLKDKQLKRKNKKQIKNLENDSKKQTDRLNRQVKAESKRNARSLVSSLYPALADKLQKVDTDGMAESLLIALYGKENQNELVQNIKRFQ